MPRIRIAFALVSQESNTFNRVPSGFARFEEFGYQRGSAVLDHAVHSPAVSGFLAGLEASGADVDLVPVLKATALAGGPLEAATRKELTAELVGRILAAGSLDGIGLLLHGACVGQDEPDVDGQLLAAVREVVGPDLPVVVGLDHHANLTERMVAASTAIIGHRTQPHDTGDTAWRTAELLVRVVARQVVPSMGFRKLRLLSHQERFLTAVPPMQTWFDQARTLERQPGVIAASTFPMQPWLDVAEAGWSTLVVTDDDIVAAERFATDLADHAWALRDEFQVVTAVPPAEAVARAAASDRLTLISDTGDSVRGGAGGDSTVLLTELLRAGAPRTLLTIVDPAAVDAVWGSEPGDQVEVTVGGRVTGWFDPVAVTGVVRASTDTVLHPDDGFALGEVRAGPTVAIDVDNITLVITARQGIAGNHPVQYTHLGLDLADYGAAVLKTASNFQHFRHLADEVVRAATPGPSQSELHTLPWRHIPRPIYPLDDVTHWHV